MRTNNARVKTSTVSARFRSVLYGLIALTIAIVGATFALPGKAATYACKNADGITEFRVTKCPRVSKARSVRRATNRSRSSKNRKSLRSSRKDTSAIHRSAQRRLKKSERSKQSKRKSRNRSRQSYARNGFDPATCRAYKNLIDQSGDRGVEFVDNKGRSTYRKTPQANRKLRKAQRNYDKYCG